MSTCPRCDLEDYGTARRADGIKHRATVKRPSVATLERAVSEGVCETTDGCEVEPDGRCEHGHTAWLRVLGYI
jgi:hypothetical protein